MAKSKKYNPEKRAWRGKSYKKGGQNVKELKAKDASLKCIHSISVDAECKECTEQKDAY